MIAKLFLAGAFAVLTIAALADRPAEAGGYPAHQCTATESHGDFCSCKKVDNHEGGNQWIKSLVEATQVKPSGKPWLEDSLPSNATWWPRPCRG